MSKQIKTKKKEKKMLKEEKMPNYTQKTQENELDVIMRILKIIECKLQKIVNRAKKEQTECKSECSKQKIEAVKREVNNLELILENIGQ